MLDLVRKHADSWMIKAILWLVVAAFVGTIFYSWGMGGSSARSGGVVAVVEGIKISHGDYEKNFNNLVEFYRDQFKGQFSQEMIEKLDLKTATLDELIHRKLLLIEAEKQHIQVSDAELVTRIKSFPAFQKDKQFDRTIYNNFLKFKRLTPSEFEANQREMLLIEKVKDQIESQVKVSASEVLALFKQEEDKIKFDYLSMPEDYFKTSAPVTEEEKTAFYEKNKSAFQVPLQINVQYIKLTAKAYESEITIRDEDIKDHYDSQVAKYHEDEQFRASHILYRVQLPEVDPSVSREENEKKLKAAEEAAKKKAEESLKKIRAGASFTEMAKTESDDKMSGSRGGELGIFPRGTMVPEFENTLAKLKPGELSEPVQTPYGYHIIRLDEKREARTKPLEEVREVIVNELKEVKARQKARRIAKHIYEMAKNDNDLVKAAQTEKIEAKTTGLISKEKHLVQDIGPAPEFFNTVFSLPDNEVSSPINTADASYVLKVTERKLAYIPELEDIKDQVTQAALNEKNKALTDEKLQALADQAAKIPALEELAKNLNLTVKHTAFFSSTDSIPGIGNVQSIKDKAFTLENGQTATAHARNFAYLIKLTDKQPAGEPDKDKAQALQTRLQKEKGSAVFDQWLKDTRQKANIMIDKSLI